MTYVVEEVWGEVPALTNLTESLNREWTSKYLISNYGRVWSTRSKRILKPSTLTTGYHVLATKLGSKPYKNLTVRIHRLVAKVFIENPCEKPQVNHINGTKTDNFVLNLEWNTASENGLHSSHVLGNKPKKGYENPLSVLGKEEREVIKASYVPRHKEYGARALSRKYGVHHKTILLVLKG